MMKGIILAGGAGTRLYPMSNIITKQLMPIYDKPMIYYGLTFFMLGGIRDILLITTPKDAPAFKALLGDGSAYGIRIQYATQDAPRGIPEAFTIGESFIGNDDVNLLLGDNLFYGDMHFYRAALRDHAKRAHPAESRIFAYSVSDPQRYGVVEFEKGTHRVVSIEEKPQHPKSNFAIPGLYIFDASVVERTRRVKPSARGETEITELLKSYWAEGHLLVNGITRGVAWIDTGTPKAMLDASIYISSLEERQGLKIGCIEEVAYRMEYISSREFIALVEALPKSPYRSYLERLREEI